MIRNLPITASKTVSRRPAILLALATVTLLAIACINGGAPPAGSPPTSTPTQPDSPATPTDTAPSQPTAEPTADPGMGIWATINGMWSGCPADAGGGLFINNCPTDLDFPIGPFITLYLPPTCNVGQACGVYIKGSFSSEFIAFELTLEGYIQGRAQFYADPGTGMYEGMDRTLYLSVSGGQLNVEELQGETYLLSPGCDPLIVDGFMCMNTMPG